MPLAVLSDIHGNLPALEAVIADMARRGIQRVATLGDHVSGPLWPRETADCLMAQPWLQIAGNHERQMLTEPRDSQGLSDRFASLRLAEPHWAWLASLPARAQMEDGTLLVHGTPRHDDVYLLERVLERRVHLARPEVIAARLRGLRPPLLLCGHSHVPRVVEAEGTLIVNPGSVGVQAYDDDGPEPHIVEVGSPHARYAVLRRFDSGWHVELVALPYDHETAARRAEANGRPGWAHALRTGYWP